MQEGKRGSQLLARRVGVKENGSFFYFQFRTVSVAVLMTCEKGGGDMRLLSLRKVSVAGGGGGCAEGRRTKKQSLSIKRFNKRKQKMKTFDISASVRGGKVDRTG